MPDSPNSTPVSAGLVARVAQGIRYAVSGVGPADWFGPAQPTRPMAQDQALGRVLDYRAGYNLTLRPRDDEAIGFNQLRALADACGILRLVIETRKDQMERLTWSIQPRLEPGIRRIPNDPRIANARNFLRRPDGHNGWATWLRQVLEELLVTDAVALYRRTDAAGRLHSLQQIDGATVKRVIDESGLTPLPPDPAYQQILHGLPAVDYTSDQLLYLPRNKRIHKLYGFSPVEQVVMIVNIALRRQVAQLNYFTEGNIPEALISCPVDWRPSQIREMQEIFDDMLRGDLASRSGAKFVPGGLNVQFTKDALLKDEFDEWLARIICYAFSVPPTPFVKQSNRATADNASDSAMAEGLAPIQSWVKALIDRVLAEDFAAPDVEFVWNEDRTLTADQAMAINTGYVAAGLKTRNEIRADLGLGPLPGGDAALATIGTGLVPIVAPSVPVGKDWHFDPGQPRDAKGRWVAEGDGEGDGDGDGGGYGDGGESGDDDGGGDGDDSDGSDSSDADADDDSGDDADTDSSDDSDDSDDDDGSAASATSSLINEGNTITSTSSYAEQTNLNQDAPPGDPPDKNDFKGEFDKLIPIYAPVELQDAIGKAEGSDTDTRWASTEGYGAIPDDGNPKFGRYQIDNQFLYKLGIKSGLGPNDWNTAFGYAYGIKSDDDFVPQVTNDFDAITDSIDTATLNKAKDAQNAALAIYMKDLNGSINHIYDDPKYQNVELELSDGRLTVLNKGVIAMAIHNAGAGTLRNYLRRAKTDSDYDLSMLGMELKKHEPEMQNRLYDGQDIDYDLP